MNSLGSMPAAPSSRSASAVRAAGAKVARHPVVAATATATAAIGGAAGWVFQLLPHIQTASDATAWMAPLVGRLGVLGTVITVAVIWLRAVQAHQLVQQDTARAERRAAAEAERRELDDARVDRLCEDQRNMTRELVDAMQHLAGQTLSTNQVLREGLADVRRDVQGLHQRLDEDLPRRTRLTTVPKAT